MVPRKTQAPEAKLLWIEPHVDHLAGLCITNSVSKALNFLVLEQVWICPLAYPLGSKATKMSGIDLSITRCSFSAAVLATALQFNQADDDFLSFQIIFCSTSIASRERNS
jgi:hypothetical protein